MTKNSFLENTFIGTTAGVIETILLQPMLYWKNAMQQNIKFTLNPFFLYRGVNASIINMSVLTGMQIPLTETIKTYLPVKMSENEKLVHASFYSGVISGLVCAPMELIMIQQQLTGHNMKKTVSRIGYTNLMRGLVTSCGREGIYAVGYLGLGPYCSDIIQKKYNTNNTVSNFYGSIISSVISATLSHPLDTVKTCMQGDIKQIKYSTIIKTTINLFRDKGILRFFDGYWWRTSRMVLSFFILIESKSRISALL